MIKFTHRSYNTLRTLKKVQVRHSASFFKYYTQDCFLSSLQQVLRPQYLYCKSFYSSTLAARKHFKQEKEIEVYIEKSRIVVCVLLLLENFEANVFT